MVTVAALPSLCAGALAQRLAVFRQSHPGVEVRLRDLVAERIVERVREGDVDFGVGVRSQFGHGLDFTPLLSDRLCLFVPVGHPLATGPVDLQALDGLPMILTGRDSSVRAQIEEVFRAHGLVLQAAMEANYMSTVLALVRNGLGLRCCRNRRTTVHTGCCAGPWKREVWSVKSASSPAQNAACHQPLRP